MENMYSLDPATTSTEFHHQGPQLVLEKLLHGQFEASEAANNIHETNTSTMDHHHHHHHQHQQMSDAIKAQIASHPLYPDLVSAYIQCRQVGAPPEMALLLEEIGRDQSNNPLLCGGGGVSQEIGTDPELDEFMESYCKVLLRYKEELSKPFDEATTFLNNIEIQLSNLLLSKGTSSTPTNTTTTTTATTSGTGSYYSPDGAAGSSEEELSCGEAEASESHESSAPRAADQELKEMLMRKYSGYLSSLRKEFLKKRKKGKLPKDARTTLMDWWNTHCRWPYPTEEEKMKLADATGLDQKQINNWFINQRKRHWKPSEDMRFALMEGVGGGAPVYFDSSGKGPADNNDLC